MYQGLKSVSGMTHGAHFAEGLGRKKGGMYLGVLCTVKVLSSRQPRIEHVCTWESKQACSAGAESNCRSKINHK